MLDLIYKDLFLLVHARAFWVSIATYWIMLLYFKLWFQPLGLAASANVFMGFMATAAIGSIVEGVEARSGTEALTLSLPVTRAAVVRASYGSGLLVCLLGLSYTYLAGVVIAAVVPTRLLKAPAPLGGRETALLVLLWAANMIVQTPLNFRYGALSRRKVLFFFLIVTTLVATFFLLPLGLLALLGEGVPLEAYRRTGPFAPLLGLGARLGEPLLLGSGGALIAVLLIGSVLLSTAWYRRRDLA